MNLSIRHDPFPVLAPYQGIYAHGVETAAGSRLLHISGQYGQPPEGALPLSFKAQCRQALLNLESVLQEADMGFSNLIKMSFYLIRREDMEALLEVRRDMLEGVRPTLFVAGLVSPQWLIEVEAIASGPSA